MLNSMQSRFARGPRRWLAVPVLGVAAGAALAALAVSANGLPVALGTPAAATQACPTRKGPMPPCPYVAPRPIHKFIPPAPLGPLPKGISMATLRQFGSTLTPAQQSRLAGMRAQYRAYFDAPSTVPAPKR